MSELNKSTNLPAQTNRDPQTTNRCTRGYVQFFSEILNLKRLKTLIYNTLPQTTVKCRYNAVEFIMVLHTALR